MLPVRVSRQLADYHSFFEQRRVVAQRARRERRTRSRLGLTCFLFVLAARVSRQLLGAFCRQQCGSISLWRARRETRTRSKLELTCFLFVLAARVPRQPPRAFLSSAVVALHCGELGARGAREAD